MSAFYGGAPQETPSSPGGSTEKSVKSCYAVVYELKNRKWAVSGEGGWSEVHLCEDSADDSHRILAWTVKNQNVLMNCNVTGECSYKEKSKNFHSFTDENGSRFGLGFHKSDSGLRQALHFLNSTVAVIKSCKQTELNSFTLASSNSGSMPPPNPYQSNNSNDNTNNNNINHSSYNSYSSKPLPPMPSSNNNQSNNVDSNTNTYTNNDNQNNYSNNNNNNTNHSANKPQPPPFMSSNASQSSHGHKSSPPPARTSSPKPPPPNPFQQQKQQQQQAQQQQSKPQPPQPPPAFSSAIGGADEVNNYVSPQVQAQAQVQSQPQASQSQSQLQPKAPPSFGQSSQLVNPNNSYPQLQKPQSPYQSTTENVSLSPVQAAVHGDEHKSAQKSPMAEANLPNYHLSKNQLSSVPTQPIGPIGRLKILPPKPSKLQSGDKKILNPDNVEHTVRVVHDKDTGQFHGLPKEWMDHLNKQFGVKPHLLPSVKLDAYEHKIPKVLITLRARLENANAYDQVGIFRLAPNATENDKYKGLINKGDFDNADSSDFNVYANLIKVWFRDLPDPLLNCVDPTKIELAQKDDDVQRVVSQFPEPQKSIFLWLCDMCVECAKHEKVNKMGAQNLAIVIGPNLFNTENFENPMKAMTFSGKVVQFFKLAITNRQKELAANA